MSKYDEIESLKDLITEVRIHGLSTEMNDIVRVQDIIGHDTEESIKELAENGDTRDNLFLILRSAWDFERVVRTWNQYVNPNTKKLRNLEKENTELKAKNAALEKTVTTMNTGYQDLSKVNYTMSEKIDELSKEVDKLKAENVELKCRIYDVFKEKIAEMLARK